MHRFVWKFLLGTLYISCTYNIAVAENWTKTLSGSFYSTILNTPFGITVGEKDSRTQLQPYNGIFLSNDLGETWEQIGLSGRGITSITLKGLDIYAATYYKQNNLNGVFLTHDKGNTWTHIGPNYSASAIDVQNNVILAGYYSHGLWVSFDNGTTFEQKIGENSFGPTILNIKSNNQVTIVGTEDNTYKSTDKGKTWTTIEALNNKQISQIVFANTFIFAGTYDLDGLYLSKDNGQNWEKIQSFGTASVTGLFFHKNIIYAGKYDTATNLYSIYKSKDMGKNWENTDLNLVTTGTTTNVSYIYAHPEQLIAAISKNGVFKMNIPENAAEANKFLNLPWKTKKNSELTDKIYSYFDHSYPLLGYNTYKEPDSAAHTTLNFLGQQAEEPELYYSSHNGIDFGLVYGTPILAPAQGVASYYYCKDCGNTIKINHLNGYQTIYEHLQEADLLLKSGTAPVGTGEVIGKVGLTGRTSGPHLHFEVVYDSNTNGSFTDEFPQGRVDPFGWLNTEFADPWQNHYWQDTNGDHLGNLSKYLWNIDFPQIKKTISTFANENIIIYENKTFDVTNIATLLPYNFEYFSYSQPHLPLHQQYLKYIGGTSFVLELYDTLKNKIETLPSEIFIEIALTQEDFRNIIDSSLKLYFYDLTSKEWKPLQSTIDLTTGILRASTTHLSMFAVFAKPIDNVAPETTINIEGTQENNWYIDHPIISLGSDAPDLDKIFYSLDSGNIWIEYTNPFEIEKNGFITVLYKSNDINGNYELEKQVLLKINLKSNPTKVIKYKDSIFNTTNNQP